MPEPTFFPGDPSDPLLPLEILSLRRRRRASTSFSSSPIRSYRRDDPRTFDSPFPPISIPRPFYTPRTNSFRFSGNPDHDQESRSFRPWNRSNRGETVREGLSPSGVGFGKYPTFLCTFHLFRNRSISFLNHINRGRTNSESDGMLSFLGRFSGSDGTSFENLQLAEGSTSWFRSVSRRESRSIPYRKVLDPRCFVDPFVGEQSFPKARASESRRRGSVAVRPRDPKRIDRSILSNIVVQNRSLFKPIPSSRSRKNLVVRWIERSRSSTTKTDGALVTITNRLHTAHRIENMSVANSDCEARLKKSLQQSECARNARFVHER